MGPLAHKSILTAFHSLPFQTEGTGSEMSGDLLKVTQDGKNRASIGARLFAHSSRCCLLYPGVSWPAGDIQ